MSDPNVACRRCKVVHRVKVCVPVQLTEGAVSLVEWVNGIRTSIYCERCAIKKGLGPSVPATVE